MKLLFLISSALSVASLIQAADHYSHPCEETYNVVKADDCKSIAADYGVTEQKLQEWNQHFDSEFQCNDLKAGDHVCVQFNEKLLKRAAAVVHKKKASNVHKPKKPAHKGKKEASPKKPSPHKKAPSHGKAAAHKKSVLHMKSATHKKDSTHKKEPAHHKKAPAHKKLPTHHKKSVAHKKAPTHKKEAQHGKKSSHHKKVAPHKKEPVKHGLGKRSPKAKHATSATVTKHHKKEKKHHKNGNHHGKKQESK
ncbi:hypothetical protein PS15m_010597 [Mucor circinelloides]